MDVKSANDFGLYDYVARFYDPQLGRFSSPDTIVPSDNGSTIGQSQGMSIVPLTVSFSEPALLTQLNQENAFTQQHGPWFQLSDEEKKQAKSPFGPMNGQSLDRYAYCLNNPIRYTDPNGHQTKQVTLSLDQLKALASDVEACELIMAASASVWGGLSGVAAIFSPPAGIIGLFEAGELSFEASNLLNLSSALTSAANSMDQNDVITLTFDGDSNLSWETTSGKSNSTWIFAPLTRDMLTRDGGWLTPAATIYLPVIIDE